MRTSAKVWYEKNKDKRRLQQKEYNTMNKERLSQYGKNWIAKQRESDPDFDRKKNLLFKYNITIEDWNSRFKQQGSCCAICKTTEPNHAKGWATDHDHKTGEFRGILCFTCNSGLGHFKDSVDNLIAASVYLGSVSKVEALQAERDSLRQQVGHLQDKLDTIHSLITYQELKERSRRTPALPIYGDTLVSS